MAEATVNEGRGGDWVVGPTAYDNTAFSDVGVVAAHTVEGVTGAVRVNGARKVRLAFISNDAAGQTFNAHLMALTEIRKRAPIGGTSALPPLRYYFDRRIQQVTGTIGSKVGLVDTMLPTTAFGFAKSIVPIAGGRAFDNYFSPFTLTTPQDGVAWAEFAVEGVKAVRCICVCANADKLMYPVFQFVW